VVGVPLLGCHQLEVQPTPVPVEFAELTIQRRGCDLVGE
jgi:hypothetical protein